MSKDFKTYNVGGIRHIRTTILKHSCSKKPPQNMHFKDVTEYRYYRWKEDNMDIKDESLNAATV